MTHIGLKLAKTISSQETGHKTLILGSIPDDFDETQHLTLVAESFLGKEDVYPDWDKLDFVPDPFADPEAFKEADRLTSAYTRQLIATWVDELNRENDVAYSYAFWRVLLFAWLNCIVQGIWERQKRVENFISLHGDREITVQLLRDNIRWDIPNYMDIHCHNNLALLMSEWMYSRLLEKMLPEKWQVDYVDKSHIPLLDPPGPKLSAIRKLKRKLYDPIFVPNLGRYYHIYGINPLEASIFNSILHIKRPKTDQTKCVDCGMTYEQVSLPFKLDVMQAAKKMMPLSLKNAVKNAGKYQRRYVKGKLNLGSQLLYGNDAEVLKAALKVEHGELIIGVQHGGHGYGSGKVVEHNHGTEYHHRYFLTWGWKELEDVRENFVPLPSPLLSKYKNKHVFGNDEALMVGFPCRAVRFHYNSVPHTNQYAAFRKGKFQFIEALDVGVRAKLKYRPMPSETHCFKDADHFTKRCPDIPLFTGPLRKRVLGCKLLIMDNPSTTFNFAMAANIPVMCFFKREWFPMCRQVQPLYEQLVEAGVIHYDPVSAAERVNAVWDDVQGWWSNPDVQSARSAWMHKMARAEKGWRGAWIRTLVKL